jgi:hypothetical protein
MMFLYRRCYSFKGLHQYPIKMIEDFVFSVPISPLRFHKTVLIDLVFIPRSFHLVPCSRH